MEEKWGKKKARVLGDQAKKLAWNLGKLTVKV